MVRMLPIILSFSMNLIDMLRKCDDLDQLCKISASNIKCFQNNCNSIIALKLHQKSVVAIILSSHKL